MGFVSTQHGAQKFMKVTRFCPAKVNLFLEVTGKRPNGYHELATLFAKISLGDTLIVSARPAEKTTLSLQLTGPFAPRIEPDENNLVCRAARAFLEHFNLNAEVELQLDKHIPTGAGLGGGSSDAAHTLLALCQIFQKNKTELLPAAAKLGADVPLFMYDDTFLKGEGIGERLTPIRPGDGPLPYLVLVYPNTVVPTAGVFARLTLPTKENILTNTANLDKLVEYLRCTAPLSDWKHLLFNRLEGCVVPFTNSVRNALLALKTNTDAVLMSGSGSSVFALVETEKDARKLIEKLQSPQRTVVLTTFYRSSTHENNGDKDTSYGRGSSEGVCQCDI